MNIDLKPCDELIWHALVQMPWIFLSDSYPMMIMLRSVLSIKWGLRNEATGVLNLKEGYELNLLQRGSFNTGNH